MTIDRSSNATAQAEQLERLTRIIDVAIAMMVDLIGPAGTSARVAGRLAAAARRQSEGRAGE